MNLLKTLKKMNSFANVASEGLVSDVKYYFDTGSYMLNAQLGRSIYHGIPGNRITILAGPPSAGKTYLTLTILKSFLEKHEKNLVLYFDTENAIETRQLKSMNIEMNRFYHIPVKTLEDFKTQSVQILSEIRKDRMDDLKNGTDNGTVFLVLDSLGMAASSKEIEDAEKSKNASDMGSRGKIIRSIFRTLTLELGLMHIPMICTTHTYQALTPYTPTGMSGGLGPQFSGSTVVELTVKRDYDKVNKTTLGSILTCKLRKSRVSKQHTDTHVKISFGRGLDRFYGLLDFALDQNIFKKDGKKIMVGNERFFRAEIEENPEKFFTDEVLKQIDEKAQKFFDYGFDEPVIDVEKEEEGDEIFDDEIESIELVGEEDTIDITVDDTHMFFANDIYTHNSSISSQVVTTDQMGGSIKKAQVGHVIITVAKTLQQKEMKLATIAITKSRIGDDGVVFENCKFDNGMIEIDTESTTTFLGIEEQKEERQRQRVKELLEKRKERENKNN
jgi:RecA/RadA recombinase